MLGRDGAWFYGYPCGPTHRIMRKSGRMKIKKETRRAAEEAQERPVQATHPRGLQGAE
jgi:hypothetical protein